MNSGVIGDGERMWRRRVLLNIFGRSVVKSLGLRMLGITRIGKAYLKQTGLGEIPAQSLKFCLIS